MISVLFVGLLLMLPAGAQADFSDGLRAFREGSFVTAYEKWLSLAENGNAKAQNNLGILYRRGLGVKMDPVEAVKWYTTSANQNFAKAQFNLGLMYKQGSGVKKDLPTAISWYKKSAENGYHRAQYALGLRFERGNGVKKNRAAVDHADISEMQIAMTMADISCLAAPPEHLGNTSKAISALRIQQRHCRTVENAARVSFQLHPVFLQYKGNPLVPVRIFKALRGLMEPGNDIAKLLRQGAAQRPLAGYSVE